MSKTVFVTGASRGIGRAIALAFGQEGFNVAVNCIQNIGLLNSLADEISAAGGRAFPIPCDMSDYGAAENAVAKVTDAFGGIDVLVNNAGISYTGLFNLMKPNEWYRLIDVNINATVNASHLVLPDMLTRRNGVIINISSIWGKTGAACEVVYSMTKGAVNAFTRALARETAPNGIRVNAVSPGVIDTDMNEFLSDSDREELTDRIPVSRFGTPEEAAELVLFLASGKAAYITGQIITIDGGLT